MSALMEAPPPPDGGASLLGRLGLGSELTAWLLSHGHGDILGMLPSEIARYARRPAPECPQMPPRCRARMVSRGLDFVCYRHNPPYRLRDEPLRPVYADGCIEDALGQIVGAQYTERGWETTRAPL